MSIFIFRIAENALFLIWWKSENNFSAREKTAMLRHKKLDTVADTFDVGF